MSFNPLLVPAVNYIGKAFRLPVTFSKPATEQSACAVLSITWAEYGVNQGNPNAAVNFDLGNITPRGAIIQAIRGVYIDNTGSDGSIYVYFPDTAQTVTCPPYSTAWAPVTTNNVQGVVIGKNFGTNDPSQTKVFLYNVPLFPGIISEINNTYPQWRASPQLSRGFNSYTSGFGSPALGDQWQYSTLGVAVAGIQQEPFFGTPYAGGYITLTSLSLNYMNAQVPSSYSNNTAVVSLKSIGASGIFDRVSVAETAITMELNPTLINLSGMQCKLNAAEAWFFEVNASGNWHGVFNMHAVFSYSGPGGQQPQKGFFGTSSAPIINDTTITAPTPYVGLQFTAPQTCQILDVIIRQASSNGRDYHIELWSDDRGNPGFKLGQSKTLNLPFSNTTATTVFDFPSPPVINNGAPYWIVLVTEEPLTSSIGIYLTNNQAGYISSKAATVPTLGGNSFGGQQMWAQIDYQTL